jgi:hypothetical protein
MMIFGEAVTKVNAKKNYYLNTKQKLLDWWWHLF